MVYHIARWEEIRMRIGEVATATAVNVQTLRFYEKRGLLEKPSRLGSGYRSYLPETVSIVRFIKQSQELGYTLEEIKQLLILRKSSSANADAVRALAQAKLRDLEDKILLLQQRREELIRILDSCDCGGNEARCPALDSLDHHIME
jgi:DNA-binding transcriptional MerR regulator